MDSESIKLLISFERIVNLCDSLYCTGEIENMVDAILNFYKFINNEPFDFYDTFWELREIMDLIFIELEFFKKQLHKVMESYLCFVKMKKNYNLSDILRILKEDFIKQMLYR